MKNVISTLPKYAAVWSSQPVKLRLFYQVPIRCNLCVLGAARYPTMPFTLANGSSNGRKCVHQSTDVQIWTPEVHKTRYCDMRKGRGVWHACKYQEIKAELLILNYLYLHISVSLERLWQRLTDGHSCFSGTVLWCKEIPSWLWAG